MEKMVKMVTSMTKSAKTTELWKEAVLRLVAVFGEDAIYYVDCDRFLKEEEVEAYALPYEEWQDGKRVHFGLAIQHTYEEEECQLFTYSDAPILLW